MLFCIGALVEEVLHVVRAYHERSKVTLDVQVELLLR